MQTILDRVISHYRSLLDVPRGLSADCVVPTYSLPDEMLMEVNVVDKFKNGVVTVIPVTVRVLIIIGYLISRNCIDLRALAQSTLQRVGLFPCR